MRLLEMVRLLRSYHRQSARATVGRVQLIRDFPRWFRSQGGSALDNETVWITLAALRHLPSILGPTSRVLEYGCGGSTLYFAKHAGEVVSIEHDPAWARVVGDRAKEKAKIILKEPVREPPGTYASTDERYRDMSFRAYAAAADVYADGYFDLLLIDGRARTSAFAHARRKVRPGGWIVLDNSDRPAYGSILRDARAEGWEEQRFFGPHPYVTEFGETTIWQVGPQSDGPRVSWVP